MPVCVYLDNSKATLKDIIKFTRGSNCPTSAEIIIPISEI